MTTQALKKLLAKGRGFTTRQAVAAGVSRQSLCDCHAAGKLVRMSRGVYLPAATNRSVAPEIETLQHKGGDFVLCLFSALRFYGIGTQNSPGVWIAILNTRHVPVVDFPLECVRCGPRYYRALVSRRSLNGLPLKVYTPAKTVADCFKFRNRVGLEVALEALRDGWRQKQFTLDELCEAAKACRVANVITPYLEMLAG